MDARAQCVRRGGTLPLPHDISAICNAWGGCRLDLRFRWQRRIDRHALEDHVSKRPALRVSTLGQRVERPSQSFASKLSVDTCAQIHVTRTVEIYRRYQ